MEAQISALHCLHGLVQLAAGGRGTETTPFIAPFCTALYSMCKLKIKNYGRQPVDTRTVILYVKYSKE
jgi:hypothetical protein